MDTWNKEWQIWSHPVVLKRLPTAVHFSPLRLPIVSVSSNKREISLLDAETPVHPQLTVLCLRIVFWNRANRICTHTIKGSKPHFLQLLNYIVQPLMVYFYLENPLLYSFLV